MQQLPRFRPVVPTDFSRTLRSRVNQHFADHGKTTYANGAMIFKSVVHLSIWIGAWCTLMFVDLSPIPFVLMWIVFGLGIALVTTNVGHDAIHGSYTRNQILARILEQTFNINGASAYMWRRMHNVAHHTYTNVHGIDEDISPISVIRLSPSAERKKMHRFQHWYALFFYSLATISWAWLKDYIKFFKNEVGNYNDKPHAASAYFWLFFYKLIHYAIFWVAPFYFIDMSWYYILLGIVLGYVVSGLYLAIVFMLAHGVEDVHFPLPEPSGDIDNDWAVHQLYTSANFSSNSWFASFMTGGLNQQIEHHLFPNICSIHYPAIQKIVQETAVEYDLPYYEQGSFFSAFGSHLRFLKSMGKP